VAYAERSDPAWLFERVSERKTIKNRLHLDFRPDNQDAEVERMLALGATRTEIGQGEQACLVRRDPEGNEFCVFGLRALSQTHLLMLCAAR
jgi:Glyoxalase-like domain